jgi:3-oxoacyl-[acyl-carrier protein] reductase
MGKLDGRVAVITGGARGIGKQIALTFSGEGADIVIGDVIEMETVAREIRNSGRTVLTIRMDVSNEGEVKNLFERTVATFQKVDVLVNNAAIPGRGRLMEMTGDDWDNVFDVNLKGVFLCTQTAGRYMMKRKYGKIINVTSIGGIGNAFPPRISVNYAASKAGVIRFTKFCSQELGPYGINVNAIAPGFVETDLTFAGRSPEEAKAFIEEEIEHTPLGRAGSPQDMANLALFLASEESSFITGQTIAADGGRS